eukprot:1176746-Prorocentrum_minimum.AAC.3
MTTSHKRICTSSLIQSVRLMVRNRQTVNRQVREDSQPTDRPSIDKSENKALIILGMTKSANEEPGGVLRKRIRSNCVQPNDLRNSRQARTCMV